MDTVTQSVKLKVEVRPIERKTWHGKVGEESFKRPQKLKALVNGTSMEYDTGLTEAEATKLGKHFGKNLAPVYSPDEPHPFWDSNMATITLENATQFFDPNKAMDFIKVKIMKKSRFVANSLKEYEDGLWPDATHVIFDETEEVEAKASKVEIKKTAIIECSQLSKDKKIEIIFVLAGKNLKGKSDGFVEVELDKLIERNSKDVLRRIRMDSEDISLHAMILECLQKSVLRKEGHKIYYLDHFIGGEIEDVILYLKDPSNQDLKVRLMAQINN